MSIKALTHSSVQSAAHQADRTTSSAECSLWTGRWTVIYVYLHLALQTKAGRNSFLNICPSACWWAFLFGRNFKVIVNHKYLKIASPLIKQPQKHFNDRRHESDLLASVLHTLYSLQIKVLVMHKVTHFRLFHDSLFMMHVVLVIVPRAARVSLDFSTYFLFCGSLRLL